MAAAYNGIGKRFRMYPAHVSLIRSYQRSSAWRQVKDSGEFSASNRRSSRNVRLGAMGGRPCAVFEYVGPALPERDARRLIARG